MKKLLYNTSFILLFAALALLAGCSKLNQQSTTSVVASSMFKDTVSLNEALTELITRCSRTSTATTALPAAITIPR